MSCGNIKVWSTRNRVIVNFHSCVILQVMKRIVEEYGGDLVVATLCLVETSRFGLLESYCKLSLLCYAAGNEENCGGVRW